MKCSCIKNTAQSFDFHLESLDCKTLIFKDLTNWMEEEPYVIPTTFPITITLPNGKVVNTTFNPKSITHYTGSMLETTTCLPDGIYCFKVDSCGYNYSRHKAVVCKLECKLDNYIAKVSREDDDEAWEKITEISNLINSIKVNAEIGKHKVANDIYKIVTKKLDRLECSCGCA